MRIGYVANGKRNSDRRSAPRVSKAKGLEAVLDGGASGGARKQRQWTQTKAKPSARLNMWSKTWPATRFRWEGELRDKEIIDRRRIEKHVRTPGAGDSGTDRTPIGGPCVNQMDAVGA
jgi:hypothetical protein